jgi:hypothetical protein
VNDDGDTVSNGRQSDRDENGRFRPRHRAAMFAGVQDDDISEAMRFLVSVMRNQDERTADRITAAKLILDRTNGTAVSGDVEAKFAEISEALQQLKERNGHEF